MTRFEISTPIALDEKQHLVRVFGVWYSAFSFVDKTGNRRFKVRRSFKTMDGALSEWHAIGEQYKQFKPFDNA